MKLPLNCTLLAVTATLLLATAPVPAAQADEAPAPVNSPKPAQSTDASPHSATSSEAASPFGVDLGLDTPWLRIGTDAAVYEAPRRGAGARLFVRAKDEKGERWRVYRGADYDRILKSHPDLGMNASLKVLGAKIAAQAGVEAPTPKQTPRAGLQTYVSAPHVTYERASYDTKARLYVREGEREYVHTGVDLDAILKANPTLAERDGFEAFRQRVADESAVWRAGPKQPLNTHLEVHRNPDGYVVTTWTWADGRWSSNRYEGPSLAAIASENPAAASHLRVWSDAAWAQADEAQANEAKADEAKAQAKDTTVDVAGLTLAAKKHDDDLCVVIVDVSEEALAAQLGVQAGDRLLRVNNEPVAGVEDAKQRLLELSSADRGSICVLRGEEQKVFSLSAPKVKPGTDANSK